MLSQTTGQVLLGTFPMEAGGEYSMVPMSLAASLGIPLVDVDGMGRAFPECQMESFTLGGVAATPMVILEVKGNAGEFKTISAKWAVRCARV